MTLHTGESRFSCHLCPYKGVRKERLMTHILNNHGEAELKNANTTPRRLQIEMNQFFHCPTCGKQCTSKQNLENHIKLHSGDRPYNCPHCSYKSIQKHHFESHMLYRHGDMEVLDGTLACPKCPRILHSREYLKQHMLIHQEIKPFECTVCHQTFRKKVLLVRHGRMHPEEQKGHAVAGSSSFHYYSSVTCHVCSRVLANQHTFKKHLRLHEQKRPFNCEECGMEFKQKRSLSLHMTTRHKKKNPGRG